MSLLSVEDQFRAAMLANATINGYLGGRVYLSGLPQNVPAYPAAAYQRISTQRNWVNGDTGQTSDMGWTRFQLDLFDDSDDEQTAAIAQAVVVMLRTFNAYSSGPRGGSNRVLQQMGPMRIADTQPPLFYTRMDLQIWFSDNT